MTRIYYKRSKKEGVTVRNLRAQQISSIIFQCSVLYHTVFDFFLLFIYLRPRKNVFKYPAFFYPLKKT